MKYHSVKKGYDLMKIRWKPLILSILIPLAVGGLSALITSGSMDLYSRIQQPPLAPPGILFPIVWTILYTLMGISCYRVYCSGAANRSGALTIYGIQLVLNFLWSLVFFNGQAYWAAFVIILALWVSIILMIRQFYKADRPAAYWQIPYLVWVTFAAYLNLAIAILN